MDAELMTTNITMELSAVCVGFSFDISFIAAIPNGVAALPRPSKFAVTFMHIAFAAGLPFLQEGKRRHITGFRSLDSISVIPPASAIFINPVHAHIMPSIPITSSTAPAAPLITEAESCGIRPVTAAQIKLNKMSPAQI